MPFRPPRRPWKLSDDPEHRRARSGFIRGRFKDDPRAVALMCPTLGVVFITKDGVSIASDQEIRSSGD